MFFSGFLGFFKFFAGFFEHFSGVFAGIILGIFQVLF